MKIKILRSARQDLIDGYLFYEQQSAGLGEYFRDSLISDIDSLLIHARSHSIMHGKHRKVASHFLYSIFYLVEGNEIRIHAIIDNRRDPEWISGRLN